MHMDPFGAPLIRAQNLHFDHKLMDSHELVPIVSFYRISENTQRGPSGQQSWKQRPTWFDKRACFRKFVAVFSTKHLYVIADDCNEDTLIFLRRFVSGSRIIRTSYKSGGFSFLHAARLASALPSNTVVYLSEDDWPVTSDAPAAIREGLKLADMVTLSDYPDKYIDAGTVTTEGTVGNPLISGRSEITRVYLSAKRHFKMTNSACMTFACKAGLIKTDLGVYEKYCRSGFPHDFAMFRELLTLHKRTLISPLPGCATHAETPYLTPLVDWEAEMRPFNDDYDLHGSSTEKVAI